MGVLENNNFGRDTECYHLKSFDNPIVGIIKSRITPGFNFVFKDGETTKYPILEKPVKMMVPEGQVIASAHLYLVKDCLTDVMFFNK